MPCSPPVGVTLNDRLRQLEEILEDRIGLCGCRRQLSWRQPGTDSLVPDETTAALTMAFDFNLTHLTSFSLDPFACGR